MHDDSHRVITGEDQQSSADRGISDYSVMAG